ncbi:MAG: hypothetical protein LBP50_02830 [Tannerella sp.]|jgi:hypothetical protein|nr:hypothetical protein [Tannerella sp.]
MHQNDIYNRFQEFLQEKGDGNFYILEQQVPIKVQTDYFEYSNQLRKSPPRLDETDCEAYLARLRLPDTPEEQKRKLLASLAVSGQAKAYGILKQYAEECDPALSDWAYLALMESRIVLETELSDGKQIYISTGMGGEGQRLRFFILLAASSDVPFLPYQRQMIEQESAYFLSGENGKIESLTIREKHVELLVLLPIQVDLNRLLGKLIRECNQYGNFLSKNMMITNVRVFDEEEITKFLQQIHGSHQAKS